MNWANRTIWTADCLYVLRGMNSESVDLIYLDPPFNSRADYAAPIGSKAAGAAFKDTWSLSDVDAEWVNLIEARHPTLHRVLLAAMTDSDKSYLVYMAARLLELRRVLKPTGSIYLHCDPTMSHYLKLVMDAVFGHRNFRNDICWQRNPGHSDSKQFGRVADQILFYGSPIRRDQIREPVPANIVQKHYRHRDERGSYRPENLKTTGLSGGGYLYDFHGHSGPWRYPEHRMEQLEQAGRVHLPKKAGGVPQRKRYLHEHPGVLPSSIWTDIKKARGKESTGYPTQKPLKLLERIIKASSKEGDIVLDPFCGCATTCVAAETLGREWAGIDLSPKAVELVRYRLADHHGVFGQITARTDMPRRTDLGPLPPPHTHRTILYGEQGGHCAGCGDHFKAQHLEVDHIVAKAKGGTDHVANLQLLCGHCNRTKGDRGMAYLRTKLMIRG